MDFDKPLPNEVARFKLAELARLPEFHEDHGYSCRRMSAGDAAERMLTCILLLNREEYDEAYSLLGRSGTDMTLIALATIAHLADANADLRNELSGDDIDAEQELMKVVAKWKHFEDNTEVVVTEVPNEG
jgi:hypothetical protein